MSTHPVYPFDVPSRWGSQICVEGKDPIMDFNYPNILTLFPEYLDPKRSESASFLIWYLENYYRLDPREAVDSVCDQNGDKGIDGIFVNDNTQTIVIF